MSTFRPDDATGASAVLRGDSFATPSLDRALAAEQHEESVPPKPPLSAGDAAVAAELQRLRGEVEVLRQRSSSLEARATGLERAGQGLRANLCGVPDPTKPDRLCTRERHSDDQHLNEESGIGWCGCLLCVRKGEEVRAAEDAIQEAIAAEREGCAKLVEKRMSMVGTLLKFDDGVVIAAAIRARGRP